MSLLKFYGIIPLLPLAISLGTLPYRIWKSYRTPKQTEWKPNQAMVNFALLCSAKPEELYYRICPKSMYGMLPYLHQGNIGAENKKDADAAIGTFIEAASIATGVVAAGIPIIRYFNDCLAHQSVGTCVKEGVADVLSYAGLPLIAGGYLVSRIAKKFFIAPVMSILAADHYQQMRIVLLNAEYQKMLFSLNQILDMPADDPKFIQTTQLAKQFLRMAPHIENEIHTSLGIDRLEAKSLLMPLQTACRQILIKHSHSAPPSPIAAKETAPSSLAPVDQKKA